MTKLFKTPFAAQGDRKDVPVETQPDGSVSYTQGYGYDYERDQTTDPAAKDIEREMMNGIFHDMTEATGEMQALGAAKWSEEGKPWTVRSLVYHDKKLWQSKIENNNEEPGNGWIELKADVNPVDMLYPVGIVTWFAQNRDPNTLFPGTTWKYIGENKTVRLARANGSDVMTTGGSDIAMLTVGNLPIHNHMFSANTSSFNHGTKASSSSGAHTHSISGTAASAGAHTHTISGYANGSGPGPKDFSTARSQDARWQSLSAGAHTHTVSGTAASAGAHSHTVSGTTANTGSNSAFSVTNSFIKLMGWYRSA